MAYYDGTFRLQKLHSPIHVSIIIVFSCTIYVPYWTTCNLYMMSILFVILCHINSFQALIYLFVMRYCKYHAHYILFYLYIISTTFKTCTMICVRYWSSSLFRWFWLYIIDIYLRPLELFCPNMFRIVNSNCVDDYHILEIL